MAWSAREGSSSGGGSDGWLRQEATRAETDKKLQEAIKAESGGSDANDPMASALPGMDPSAMMVRSAYNIIFIILCIGIISFFIVVNNAHIHFALSWSRRV